MSPLHASPRPGGSSRPPGSGPPRRPGGGRTLLVLPATILLGLTLAGCSGDTADDGGSRTAWSDARATALEVRTTVSRVQGGLSRVQRARIERRTAQLLERYLSAAYLHQRAGKGHRRAFPGFTPGARELALRQVGITADGAFPRAEDVRPRGAVAYVSVVAPEGRPAGATARVFLKLDVARGERSRLLQLRGLLLLTPTAKGWRIFGYDLALDPVRRGKEAQ